jgi:hypothetical protein
MEAFDARARVTLSGVECDGSSDEGHTVTDSTMTKADRLTLQILVEFLVWLCSPHPSTDRI